MPPAPESEPNTGRNNIPTPEFETTPQNQPEGQGEPFPEWSTAIKDWGGAWYFHQYGLGTIFGLLGVSAAVALLRYHKIAERGRKKVPYVILSLLALYGWSRSLFLSLDAYHSKQFLPTSVLNLLWAVGQPCIVSAYALVFIVLRNALCLQQKFQTWYTTRNIALTTVPYFAFALAAELTVSFLPRFKGLSFACQVMGTTFNMLLAFFYSFLSFVLNKKFRNARTVSMSGTVDRGRQIRVIQRICVAMALGGFTISAMQIYAISDIYGTFSEAEFVSAWPWFVFNTILRLMELYMAVLLFVVAVQRSARSRRTDIVPSVIVSHAGGKINRVQLHRHTTISHEMVSDASAVEYLKNRRTIRVFSLSWR